MINKNEGRKVEYKKWVKEKYTNKEGKESSCETKKTIGEAVFLCFGVEVLEYETSCASYSTAIIELKDGSVKNVPVEDIVFKVENG